MSGVRETLTKRYILNRSVAAAQTRFGEVRVKRSAGYGAEKTKYEYEDIARFARENGLSLREAKALIEEEADG